MQRDFDLIRALLLEAEARDPDDAGVRLDAEEATPCRSAHLRLLQEAGLLGAGDGFACERRQRLTWEGYEFLCDIRELPVWEEIKRRIRAAGATPSLSLVRRLAAARVPKTAATPVPAAGVEPTR